jgi:hypothetical protein
MSDAVLIAGELADIAAAFDRLAAALAQSRPVVNVAPAAAAVNVEPAVVNLPPQAPPVVSVAAPVVNVAAPSVSIGAPEAVGYTVRIIERDPGGMIRSFRITPN